MKWVFEKSKLRTLTRRQGILEKNMKKIVTSESKIEIFSSLMIQYFSRQFLFCTSGKNMC